MIASILMSNFTLKKRMHSHSIASQPASVKTSYFFSHKTLDHSDFISYLYDELILRFLTIYILQPNLGVSGFIFIFEKYL